MPSRQEQDRGRRTRYGRWGIDLANLTSSASYILQTPRVLDLLCYSGQNGIASALYTPIRISEGSTARAAEELLQIKGGAYFERRGLRREEVQTKLGDFAIFGTEARAARKMRDLLDKAGASKLVLCPVFKGAKDLLRQLVLLGGVIIDDC